MRPPATAGRAGRARRQPALAPQPVQRSANNDGSLTATFKEAGLGTNQNIDHTVSGQDTAIYVCVNRGGANPSAGKQAAIAGPVTATGTFDSGKNGQVTASLTVQPPFPGHRLPPGQSQAARIG